MVPLLWLLPVAAVSLWEQAFEAQPNPGTRDLDNKDYFVVEIADPEVLQREYGYHVEEPFPIKDHWLLSHAKNDDNSHLRKRNIDDARELHGLKAYFDSKPAKLRKKQLSEHTYSAQDTYSSEESSFLSNKRSDVSAVKAEMNITDPLFDKQWHLYNSRQQGHDMNVLPVWERNITGRGVTVAIVDDGLDYHHPDFTHSFSPEGSWDYNLHQQLPEPLLSDDNHGTRCAGEIAADINDACGVGIAPGAKVAGIRILSGELTKADEARSLIHQSQINHIYSCSWGPEDNGMEIDGPSPIVKRAELEGIENGRNGHGSIYVVASGNGDFVGDNCNYDGYTNSIYSITIGAIDRKNQHPFYAESCTANMVVTYSSNMKNKIVTTDRLDPSNRDDIKCTDGHSGTSAAAPIAAGVFALVLEQRPDLSWRDLQYLCRETAQKFDIVTNKATSGFPNRITDDWQITADGHYYHPSYGYGLLDADAIVRRAETWELVKPQSFYFLPMSLNNAPIKPDTLLSFEVSGNQWEEANMDHLEHVRVRISYSHQQRGKIHFQLKSPAGVVSDLAMPRGRDLSSSPVHDWEFLTVVHWNETGAGTWQLRASGPEGMQGEVQSWQLKFFGQAKDPSKAKRYSEVWDEYESPVEVVSGAEPSFSITDSTTTSSSVEKPASTNDSQQDTENAPAESSYPSSNENPSKSTSASPTRTAETADETATVSLSPPNEPSTVATSDPSSPNDTSKQDPKRPWYSGHSLWYYLVVSFLGVVLIVSIAAPIIYCFYRRRIRQAYAHLHEQNFELDDFSDFEIDDDEPEDAVYEDHTDEQEGPEDEENSGHRPGDKTDRGTRHDEV